MTEAGKFNIQIGEVRDSTVTIGDYNTVVHNNRLSPEEAAELRGVFEGLRSEVADKAPPGERDEALAQTAELEEAVVAAEPDPGRVERVLRWFKEHAPELAGSVVSVVVHPLIGKIVEGAGEAIATRLGEAIEEAG
ncbi:MAG: hypothetical protein M3141_07320 [Actinomycetota bacterium]|nr:hypothetical protein [Actinomycetota bacterium]